MAERAMPERDDYPNNSDRAKEKREKQAEKKPVKVTKGKVVQKKRPFLKRVKDAFGIKESQGVLDYILFDIIIPATQNMILDSIINGAEMAILGETRGRRGRRDYGGGSRYRYDKVSFRGEDRWDRRDREDRRAPRGMGDYEDIVFDSDRDAERVISGLVDMIDAYGQATVADLYDLSGITPEYTVGSFGWRNLGSARVRRGRDGYYLDLPRPIVL